MTTISFILLAAIDQSLDKIIYIIIILFLLSVITEKFGTLIRKYPSQIQLLSIVFFIYLSIISIHSFYNYYELNHLTLAILFLLSFLITATAFLDGLYRTGDLESRWIICRKGIVSMLESMDAHFILKHILWLNPFAHIAKSQENKDSESAAKELTLLSFIIGFSIAFTLDTPMGEILNSKLGAFDFGNGLSVIDFTELVFRTKYEFSLSKLIGLLFTGFFLSFGSKFFHDLLDRLYLIKKTRQAIKDPAILQQSSANEVLKFVENYKMQAIFEHRAISYSGQGNVQGFALSQNSQGQEVLVIKTGGTLDKDIFNKIITHQEGGITHLVPHEIEIVDTKLKPELTGVSMLGAINNYSMYPGSDEGGQICIPVIYNGETNKNHLLTCYHVVKHGNVNFNTFNTLKSINKVGQNKKEIGQVVFGKRNIYYEFAIIELTGNSITTDLPSNFIDKIDTSNPPRKLTSKDNNLKVSMYSRKDKKVKTGKIKYAIDTNTFPLPKDNDMLNVIRVVNEDGSNGHINRKGDSGSLLIDDNGYPIGMVFARIEEHCTYAISLYEIFKDHDIKLKL